MKRLYQTLEFAAGTGRDGNLDINQFMKLPYATMAARLGRSGISAVVLGQISHGELYWYSADKAVLVTRNGRVVKTAGFPENLLKSIFPTADPLTQLARVEGAASRGLRVVDIERGNYFGLLVRSTFVDLGEQDVALPAGPRRLRGWREECEAEQIGWSFKNEFWQDPSTGVVWKSLQHYMPDLPPFELSLIKPAAIA